MSTRSTLAAAALAIAAVSASFQAGAQRYIGASAGATDASDGNAIPDLITSGSVDGSGNGFKVYGGVQAGRHFALELAYVDLGKLTYSGTFFGTPVTGGSVTTAGFNVSLVGIVPVHENFSLFAKAGAFLWEAKAKDTTGGFPFSGKDDGSDLSYGLGAEWHITPTFSLRAEWEQFKAVDDISMTSVGATLRF